MNLRPFFVFASLLWMSVLVVATLFVCLSPSALAAGEIMFSPGDFLAAIGEGKVKWYISVGTLVRTLDTGQIGATAGTAFDNAGNLYMTCFDVDKIGKFDHQGNLLGTFGVSFGDSPESNDQGLFRFISARFM